MNEQTATDKMASLKLVPMPPKNLGGGAAVVGYTFALWGQRTEREQTPSIEKLYISLDEQSEVEQVIKRLVFQNLPVVLCITQTMPPSIIGLSDPIAVIYSFVNLVIGSGLELPCFNVNSSRSTTTVPADEPSFCIQVNSTPSANEIEGVNVQNIIAATILFFMFSSSVYGRTKT